MRQRARVRRCSHACARAWSVRAASAGGTQTSQHVRAVSAGFEMSRAPYSRKGSRRTQTAAGRPPQHVNRAGGARRHHNATAFAQSAIINALHTHMHTWTRVSMEHVRAGARARACVACDLQQDAERRSPPRDAEHEADHSSRDRLRPGRREVAPKIFSFFGQLVSDATDRKARRTKLSFLFWKS